MASVSVSHLIIFIASILLAAAVIGGVTTQFDRMTGAIDDRSERIAESYRTDITIINDPGSAVHNRNGNETILIYVKNVGRRTLPTENGSVEVFVDGEYQDRASVTVEVLGGDTWAPGNVIEITVDYGSLSDGTHRLKVAVRGGDASFIFRKG